MEKSKEDRIKELEEKIKKLEEKHGKPSGCSEFDLAALKIFKKTRSGVFFVFKHFWDFLLKIKLIRTSLLHSNNYFHRVVAFIIATQLLYAFAWVVSYLLFEIFVQNFFAWVFNDYSIINIVILAAWSFAFIFNILVLGTFLFKNVEAKALTYLWTTLFFLGLVGCAYLVTGQLPIFSISITFAVPWSVWQFANATILLLIGVFRTTVLGVTHDYLRQ